MAEYRFTNRAVADLNEIWDYSYYRWSEEQADIYYNMLLRQCQLLAKNPESGKGYSEISPDLLGLKAGSHIIFYRVTKPGLTEIVRILHNRMDIPGKFKPSDNAM